MSGLDEKQLAYFSDKLETLRTELSHSLDGLKEMSRPIAPDDAIGRLSRMDAMQQQKMAQAQRASVEGRLRLIAGALEAIQRDEYGMCRVCEEFIGLARLEARPESMICVSCQASRGG